MKIFGEAIKDWMVNYKRNSVKPATYDRLETSYNLMEHYKIFWVSIDQLDTDYIQGYLNDLVQDGYAMSTIKKQFHLITAFMDYANVKGIIQKPYHKGVNLPSRVAIKKPARDILAYDQIEQGKLNAVIRSLERPAYLGIILMLESGMRIGETLALSWSDVDFKRRAIRINKTFVRLGNHRKSYIQNDAKSYTSNRTVPMSSRLFDILKYAYDFDEFRNFVVHDEEGNPLGYEAVRWQTKCACVEAGIPYYGQHAFRHTFATNCYRKGCDIKKLSKFLGHSDVSITYNVYIHLFGDELEEMRLILD